MHIESERVRRIRGESSVPGDKSISHRAIMLGAVAEGKSEVRGFLPGADCRSTISCFRRLGVPITELSPTHVVVEGQGFEGLKEPEEVLDVGNSGTTIRLLMGILAGRPFHSVLLGDSSIAQRPMSRVAEPLRRMGAQIRGRAGGNHTPLSILGGPLTGIRYHSPVASAQVKSAILLAGLQASGSTSVTEPALSRDHTERMLGTFGAPVQREGLTVTVSGGARLTGQSIQVPGDISSAAFLLAAAAIVPGSELLIRNVGINPTRTGILDVLQMMGARIEVDNVREWAGEPVADLLVRHSPLQGTVVEGELIPRLIDEIPVLAVIATQAEGETIIRDAQELRVKETDRIAVVSHFLNQMGAKVEPTEDGMRIQGPTPLTGAAIHSAGDHRIAMSAYVAGLVAEGKTQILGSEAIDISFPSFEHTLKCIIEA